MSRENLLDLGGWEHRPDVIDRICTAAGKTRFWDVHPEHKGAHKGKTALWHLALADALGAQPVYKNQSIGNCVGRAGARCIDIFQAMQRSWRAFGLSASTYGFARVEIGYGVHGSRISGDGAVVAYACEAMATMGTLFAEKYWAGKDFTGRHDDDSLDLAWGKSGVPDDLEPAARPFILRDWQPVFEADEAADAIAVGCLIDHGTSQAFWGRSLPAVRDKNGFLYANGSTGHSWIECGIVDLGAGNYAFVSDNKSWGDGWVGGPEGQFPIGAGRFLMTPGDFNRMIKAGEANAVGFVQGLVPAPGILDWITL